MVNALVFLPLLAATATAQWRGRPTRFTTSVVVQPTSAVQPANPQGTQTLYGQCGGQTYTGPRNCPNGAYCKSADNVWYSQCVPIAEANPAQPSGAETRTLTTAFTVDGPYPTVITTRITYLQPRPTSTSRPVEIVTVTLVPDEPCDHDFYCEK